MDAPACLRLPEKLTSARLLLKPLSAEWLDEIFAANQGNVSQYFYKFDLRDDLQTWINESRREAARGQKVAMVILDGIGGEFLGMVSLLRLATAPEVGIWLKEGAQGYGYAQEAIRTLLKWHRLNFGYCNVIRYLVEPTNAASVKLALRLNGRYRGQVRNPEGRIFQEFWL